MQSRNLLFALLACCSPVQAALFSASDSNSALVAEYPYLQPGKPCLHTICALDRTLSPGATGFIDRVVFSVTLEQSPYSEVDSAGWAIFLKHNGQQLLLTPMGPAAVSGGALTLTFDDAALNVRPPMGFQTSGTYRPTEDQLSGFNRRGAAGAWILTVIEFHEQAGFVRYLGSSIDVWTVPFVAPLPPVLTVPEPGTWAMMVAGMGLLGLAVRR